MKRIEKANEKKYFSRNKREWLISIKKEDWNDREREVI